MRRVRRTCIRFLPRTLRGGRQPGSPDASRILARRSRRRRRRGRHRLSRGRRGSVGLGFIGGGRGAWAGARNSRDLAHSVSFEDVDIDRQACLSPLRYILGCARLPGWFRLCSQVQEFRNACAAAGRLPFSSIRHEWHGRGKSSIARKHDFRACAGIMPARHASDRPGKAAAAGTVCQKKQSERNETRGIESVCCAT